jgi:hypothetical protein
VRQQKLYTIIHTLGNDHRLRVPACLFTFAFTDCLLAAPIAIAAATVSLSLQGKV